jgi:hypothetical protein
MKELAFDLAIVIGPASVVYKNGRIATVMRPVMPMARKATRPRGATMRGSDVKGWLQ